MNTFNNSKKLILACLPATKNWMLVRIEKVHFLTDYTESEINYHYYEASYAYNTDSLNLESEVTGNLDKQCFW